VALQGTGVHTRNSPNGSFRLRGVPVGRYYTLAVGPFGPMRSDNYLVVCNVCLPKAGAVPNLGTLLRPGPYRLLDSAN